MNNYEYIISSLPALSLDWKFGEGASFDTYVGWIKSQLSESDQKVADRLLDGFKDENLTREFYEAAVKDGNRFLKEYFTFDLNVRNGKARFLNKAFDRPLEQDTIRLDTGEFAEAQKLEEALDVPDLISRERGLDSLMWDKITEITTFDYFDLEAVLGFIARLRIISRWFTLDETTGREMFIRLVDEVRGTFKGVKYEPAK